MQSSAWLIVITAIAPIFYVAIDATFIATLKIITTTDTIQALLIVQATSRMYYEIFENSIQSDFIV